MHGYTIQFDFYLPLLILCQWDVKVKYSPNKDHSTIFSITYNINITSKILRHTHLWVLKANEATGVGNDEESLQIEEQWGESGKTQVWEQLQSLRFTNAVVTGTYQTQ